MTKQVANWSELLALPRFRMPESDRWWKIEPINDDGDMGLWALKVPDFDEWVFVAHITEPEPGGKAVAVHGQFGVQFKHAIDITSIRYNPATALERGMSELDKGWPCIETALEKKLRERGISITRS